MEAAPLGFSGDKIQKIFYLIALLYGLVASQTTILASAPG